MYEIVDVIKAKVIEMELEHKKLTSQLSTVECAVKDLYHILELDNLNAVEISLVAKKLRENLRLRRKLKEAIMPYSAFKGKPSLEKDLVNWLHLSTQERSDNRVDKYKKESEEARKRIFG
jgi:hypothetical protein